MSEVINASHTKVKINKAASMISTALRLGVTPMLTGSPGCGKSAIVHQVAKKFRLKVIDLRLSQCDPTDLLGFPQIKDGKAGYVPMETFPIEGDPIPEGYDGWLLFLDEMNAAAEAVQAAAYKLVLDRQVGIYNLHKRCLIAAAGNLETDGAIVQPMSTALQSRILHMEMVTDLDEWLDWAVKFGISSEITSFVQFKPQMIYTFKPNHTDKTYACPRTWEFADRFMKDEEAQADIDALLAGSISDGVAAEFTSFCKIYRELPAMNDVLSAPATTNVPSNPGILFAMTGSLSHHMTLDNMDQMMIYINRLPKEFQVVTLKDVIRRDREMLKKPAVQKWATDNAQMLFGRNK